jgi:hypothetical protein
MATEYVFLDEWEVQASPDVVFEALAGCAYLPALVDADTVSLCEDRPAP